MSENTSPELNAAPKPRDYSAFGFVVTGVVLVLVGVYMWHEWEHVLQMSPHDFIETVGAVAAPLGFLWLVLGYLQTGDELRHSSHALYLQSAELSNSVEQQRQLVEVTREQIKSEQVALADQRREIERQSAPIFVIRKETSGSMNANISSYYSITNVGAPCSYFRLSIEPMKVKSENAVMDRGGRIEFQLGFHIDVGPVEQKMVIEYIDALGQSRRQRFIIEIVDDPSWNKNYGEVFIDEVYGRVNTTSV